MHLYIDSADVTAIGALARHPAIAGVTTNPTLQRAAQLDDAGLRRFLGRTLSDGARAVHVQVKARDADEIVEQGASYAALAEAGRIFVKVPATEAGLDAVSRLSDLGVPCTVTAAFELEQVVFAQACGARYVAPYLGRMNDAGIDGLQRVREMQTVLERYGEAPPDCRLLVASVRSREDLLALLEIGVGAVTLKPELVRRVLNHEATIRSEEAFLRDAAAADRPG